MSISSSRRLRKFVVDVILTDYDHYFDGGEYTSRTTTFYAAPDGARRQRAILRYALLRQFRITGLKFVLRDFRLPALLIF